MDCKVRIYISEYLKMYASRPTQTHLRSFLSSSLTSSYSKLKIEPLSNNDGQLGGSGVCRRQRKRREKLLGL